jgi:hypothetical protein
MVEVPPDFWQLAAMKDAFNELPRLLRECGGLGDTRV